MQAEIPATVCSLIQSDVVGLNPIWPSVGLSNDNKNILNHSK